MVDEERRTFSERLTELKRASPHSYKRLEQMLGRPSSTIHGWCTGKHLPYARDNDSFGQLLALLGVDPEEQLDLLRQAIDLRAREAATNNDTDQADADGNPRSGNARTPQPVNPYRSLAPYTELDSHLFFGREQLVGDLVRLVQSRAADEQMLPAVVVGASGAGKTSLLRAGAIPRLRRAGFTVAYHALERPDALRELVDQHRVFETVDHFVVVLDDFEHVLVHLGDDDRRSELDAFHELCSLPATTVVVAIRADSFDAGAQVPLLFEALRSEPVMLGPLTLEEIAECVLRPAAAAGLDLEPELLAALVNDLIADANGRHPAAALPLLSHVLFLIASTSPDGRLRLDHYRALGGLDHALERTAEEVFTTLDTRHADACRALFLHLVELDLDETPLRRTRSGREPIGRHTAAELAVVIEAFEQNRLVIVDDHGVSVAHEALLTAWPRLRDWIDEERETLRTARRIHLAARNWEELDRDPSILLRGSQLDLALRVAGEQSDHDRLDSTDRDFIAESRAERDRQQRHDADVLSRQLAMQAAVVRHDDIALAAQIAVIAHQASPTQESRSAILSAASPLPGSRYLCALGQIAVTADPPRNRLVVANSPRGGATVIRLEPQAPDARRHRAAPAPRDTIAPLADGLDILCAAIIDDHGTIALGRSDGAIVIATMTLDVTAPPTTRATDDANTTVAASNTSSTRNGEPTGADPRTGTDADLSTTTRSATDAGGGGATASRAATESSAATTTRAATTAGSPTGAAPGTTTPTAATAIADTDTSASASAGARVGVTPGTATRGGVGRVVQVGSGPIRAIARHPDGARLVVTGAHGVSILTVPSLPDAGFALDIEHLRHIDIGDVVDVAVSPDGTRIVTAGIDGSIRSFTVDGTTSGSVVIHPPSSTTAGAVAFDPTGTTLFAGLYDGSIHVWQEAHTASPRKMSISSAAFGSWVNSVTFSPSGRVAVAASSDGTVRFWKTDTWAEVGSPIRHPAVVTRVHFVDDHTLVTSCEDGVVRTCNAPDDDQLAADTTIWSIDLDRSGTRLMTSSRGRTSVRAVATRGSDAAPRTVDPDPDVGAVDPDPDVPDVDSAIGRTIELEPRPPSHEPSDSAPPAADPGEPADRHGNAFDHHPGGDHHDSAPAVHQFVESGAASLSPDGRTVVIGTREGAVMVGPSDGSEPARPLDGIGTGLVECVCWSSDSRSIAAVDRAGLVQVWASARTPPRSRPSSESRPSPDSPSAQTSSDQQSWELVATAQVTPPGLGVAFNADATLLAAVAEDSTATILAIDDESGLRETSRFSTGGSFAMSVAFHPALNVMAVGNADRTTSLWDCSREVGSLIARIADPGGHVMALAFDADGRRLAGGSTDGKIWIWDVSEIQRPTLFAAIASGQLGVYAVAFDADGTSVFGAGPQQRVGRWSLDETIAMDAILSSVGDPISEEEWSRLVPSQIPYRDLTDGH